MDSNLMRAASDQPTLDQGEGRLGVKGHVAKESAGIFAPLHRPHFDWNV